MDEKTKIIVSLYCMLCDGSIKKIQTNQWSPNSYAIIITSKHYKDTITYLIGENTEVNQYFLSEAKELNNWTVKGTIGGKYGGSF